MLSLVGCFFLFLKTWPKTTEVTLWLDPRRGHGSVFPLDAYVDPAEAAGVSLSRSPTCPPSFSFHFPRYTQSSDIHHLPYQFFKKKILMLHIRHGYLPTNTFGNWAAPILCVFPQGRSPVARAGDSCSRLLGQHVHLQRGNTPQGLLLFWGPQEAHHFMKLTPSPSRKRLLQTDV